MAFPRRLLLLGLAAMPVAARSQDKPADHAHEPPAATPAPTPAEAGAPRQRQAAPPDAYVYIGWPQDRQVIYGTRFKLWFGTRNFGVAPAGVSKANTGHHHLLIDVDLPDLNKPIPNDRNHLHFGLGQTETMLELPPGTHTLQLLMGDADHVPHDPPVMSKRITITVRPGKPQAVSARAAP
ncbi:MAG: DUF4399 domain-containing protein [Paracraurococcus sp.]|jgi:hypothetical protein